MPKISTYENLGLPDGARHTIFAISVLLFLSPYLAGADFGIAKVPEIKSHAIDLKIIGPALLAMVLLGYAKIWPRKVATKSNSVPLAYIAREKLRFGLNLGWQLARFELTDDSPFPEAAKAAMAIKAEITDLLAADSFPKSVQDLSFRELMRSVLSYYCATDMEKHGAILVGVAAMRASLIGVSTDQGRNAEMSDLALSALAEADHAIIPDKQGFFEALLQKSPNTITDLARVVEEDCR
ncbi:hypothetical protein FHR20_001421 [Sphingomonas leidyi]|uniref:Uncharacterized protein n=1 Tax=Sphingomonas leidyi TaxID=68569 RepID=A0A7X5UY86_9SPHN|nr:hypothetical protein [Sphingomonas leidyi]NIJ64490.1 hypothetical protein [Sphingomonas leidyi]